MLEILKKFFPNARIQHTERDKLMPHRGTLSIQKAKALLGYSPKNPIEIGFQKYIRWYQEIFRDGQFA